MANGRSTWNVLKMAPGRSDGVGMDSAHEIITRARALIADPNHWCQHINAKLPSGRPDPTALDPAAVRWCASGAVLRAALDSALIANPNLATQSSYLQGSVAQSWAAESFHLLNKLVDDTFIGQHFITIFGHRETKRPFKVVWHVNDHLGYDAVLSLFDLALA